MITEKKTIGVIVAMDKELILFADSFETKTVNVHGFEFRVADDYDENTRVVIVKSGIGKVNAAIATTLLITEWNPDVVVTSGVCGSLAKTGVAQGDIYVYSLVRYHDVWCGEPNRKGQVQDKPVSFNLAGSDDTAFVNAICERFRPERTVWWARAVSGDWFVDTVEKADEINGNFSHMSKLLAVDMESGAIAQTCDTFGKRCVAVRIVSDAILNPDCGKYDDFWPTAGNVLHELLKTIISNINLLSATCDEED